MTTTVKKRLQAVVALLVTLMLLIGLMPASIWQGMKVSAADVIDLNSDIEADDYYWIFFDTQGLGTLDQYQGSTHYSSNWSGYTIEVSTDEGSTYATMGSVNPFVNNGSSWGRKVWCIGFGSQPSGNLRFRCYGTSDTNHKSITVSYRRNALYRMANEYNTSNGWKVEDKDTYVYKNTNTQQGSQEETITQGEIKETTSFSANFFDYYDDSQISNTGNGSTYGNFKVPYKNFNKAIKNSDYGQNVSYPMYLGQFWFKGGDTHSAYYQQGDVNYKGGDIRAGNLVTRDSDDNWVDSSDTLPNFKFRANLALRTTSNGPSSVYNSVVQGLVDGIDGNVPTLQNKKVPYFDSTFVTGNNGKSYNTDFVFYKRKGASSTLTAGDTSSQDYYVFDSTKDIFLIDPANGSVTKGRDVDESQKTKDIDGDVAFLPFNTPSNSGNGKNTNNYGFGTRLDITFQLTDTGTFDGQANGSPFLFRFKGDDDVWVFIDGVLVLDMGGAHREAEGEINFKTKEVAIQYYADVVNTAASTSLDTNIQQYSKDDQVMWDNNNTLEALGIKSYAVDGSINDPTDTFDPITAVLNSCCDGKTHTLKMFYMERGMLNSNLYVQFNMVDSPNKYTLVEQTDFTGVNYGLQAATQQAAEFDVFNYAIQNASNGTVNIADATEGVNYPTLGTYQRTNSDIPTQNVTNLVVGNSAGTSPSLFTPVTNNSYLVANTSYWWTDGKAVLSGGSSGADTTKASAITDNTGHFRLMYGTADDISKAEFQKQFVKGTKLLVNQEDNLYTVSGGSIASVASNPRTVTKYYTKTTRAYDEDGELTITANGLLDTFDYGSADDSVVKITQYYFNSVNTGSITITKQLSKQDSVNANPQFEFEITFSDIFGKSGNNISSSDYERIITSQGNLTAGTDCGKFTLGANDSITISGIPIGTMYTIRESSKPEDYGDEYFQVNGTGNSAKVITSVEMVGDVAFVCTNTPPDPEEDKVDIGIIKKWYPLNSSTVLPNNVEFLLMKTTDSGNTWEKVNVTGTNNGVVTLSSTGAVMYKEDGTVTTDASEAEYVVWKLSARITVTKESNAQYKILEYSEGRKTLVLENEGLYATDCKAYYEDNNVVTNLKSVSSAQYSNNAELVAWLVSANKINANDAESVIKTAVESLTSAEKATLASQNISINPVIDLSVKNEYIPMGTAMPKTGAAGVWAVVTFGAFAITIAGIALLIYRKKFQTVNISAVKGRAIK